MYSPQKNTLEYTLPLGNNGLDDADMDQQKSIFVSFMLRLRTPDGALVTQYISTKTRLETSTINEKCLASTRLEVDLKDLLQFDILDGLMTDDTLPETHKVPYFTDVAVAHNTARSITSNAAMPLTLLLRATNALGGAAVLQADAVQYDINVVTMFSMYFISNVKKDAMLQLLNSGAGFAQKSDGIIHPTDELLRICPLHRIKGVYGCIARFEVQAGLYEFETSAFMRIPPDPTLCESASQSWAQAQRAESMAFVTDMDTHAANVRQAFGIVSDAQMAFMVSQDVPWSEAEFRNDKSLSLLQYPQVPAFLKKNPACSPHLTSL